MPYLVNDLSASADRFVELIRQQRITDAFSELDAGRAALQVDLREALDRKIAHRLAQPEFLLQWPLPHQLTFMFLHDGDAIRNSIDRIHAARLRPPPMPDSAGKTLAQLYDIYSSIVEVRGNRSAADALNGHRRVILGLRVETSTLANHGKGVYDDRLVVLAKGLNGGPPSVEEFTRFTTEPTAQYDGNHRNTPAIVFRRAEGDNVSGDAQPELGRLAAGTIEMRETTHANPSSAGTNFSLRPTDAAVASGAHGVQRDTNHDGEFNALDSNGSTALNNTFKIHSGSRNNTDSAGCQTIHPDDYQRFRKAVTADATQTRWHYVLSPTGARHREWHIPMNPMSQPGRRP